MRPVLFPDLNELLVDGLSDAEQATFVATWIRSAPDERRDIERRDQLMFVLPHPRSPTEQTLASLLAAPLATVVYDRHDMELLRLPTTGGS